MARVPCVRIAVSVAGQLLVLLAVVLMVRNAASADTPRALETASARECGATARVVLEPGVLRRTFEAVKRDRNCWAESICAAVAEFSQVEYDRFVRLARVESVARSEAERAARSREDLHFALYTDVASGPRAYQCLEQRGESAPPDVKFDLYLIAKRSSQVAPTNPYRWLGKAVEAGYAPAQYEMTNETFHAFAPGVSVPPEVKEYVDVTRFHDLLRRAAEGGVPGAQLQLARFYLGKMRAYWGNTPLDVPAAIRWYRSAADQKRDRDTFEYAVYELGTLYAVGKHVPQDYAQAFREFSRLDVTQDPCARLRRAIRAQLIRMYEEGLGVARDPQKADELRKYSRACFSSK